MCSRTRLKINISRAANWVHINLQLLQDVSAKFSMTVIECKAVNWPEGSSVKFSVPLFVIPSSPLYLSMIKWCQCFFSSHTHGKN